LKIINKKTTVFCAVWCGDNNRHELIKTHYQNLKAQTRGVEIVYIFDGGDTPPSGLDAMTVSSSKGLTIYEAWNLALACCQTPYVMNLNLDDRLNTNAVELMEIYLEAQNADLVGGDWKICHTQLETDMVSNCYEIAHLPFIPDWPPKQDALTRLGSGTGERGTYGPATLWKLENHIQIPRYPYRTDDGLKIRGISDSIWWTLLEQQFKKKIVRMPIVVGNYYSHPESQAEFRVGDEWALIRDKRISLI